METVDDKGNKNTSLQLLNTYGDSDVSDSEEVAATSTEEVAATSTEKVAATLTEEVAATSTEKVAATSTEDLAKDNQVLEHDSIGTLVNEQESTRAESAVEENEDTAASLDTAEATAYLLNVENGEPVEENKLNDILEKSQEIQDMVLKKNIINACAHGPLQSEEDEEFDCIISENSTNEVIQYQDTDYRDEDSDETVSSDSSSDIHSVKEVQDLDSSEEDDVLEVQADGKRAALKVKGELGLEDLPPIEDLAISVPEQECIELGAVWNIVDTLVIVQPMPQMPAVDLESVLFLDKGERPLGKVYDVFGPVTEPYYCVRFNSAEHIQERGITKGLKVYVAPKTDHTQYVFLSELMKIKGSDASWLNDVEPPPNQVEFSDDEEERRAKKASRDQRRPEPRPDNGKKGEGEREGRRNNNFVERMNRRNLQRTAEAMRQPARPPPNNPFVGNTNNAYGYRRCDDRFQRVPSSGSPAGFFPPPDIAHHEMREWHNMDRSQMEAYRQMQMHNMMMPPVFHYNSPPPPPLPDMSVPPPLAGAPRHSRGGVFRPMFGVARMPPSFDRPPPFGENANGSFPPPHNINPWMSGVPPGS